MGKANGQCVLATIYDVFVNGHGPIPICHSPSRGHTIESISPALRPCPSSSLPNNPGGHKALSEVSFVCVCPCVLTHYDGPDGTSESDDRRNDLRRAELHLALFCRFVRQSSEKVVLLFFVVQQSANACAHAYYAQHAIRMRAHGRVRKQGLKGGGAALTRTFSSHFQTAAFRAFAEQKPSEATAFTNGVLLSVPLLLKSLGSKFITGISLGLVGGVAPLVKDWAHVPIFCVPSVRSLIRAEVEGALIFWVPNMPWNAS